MASPETVPKSLAKAKRKIPLKTSQPRKKTATKSLASPMSTRSIPISMPDRQQAALFDLLAQLTGNKNNRSEMARLIFGPYMDLVVAILKADGLMSEQNKFLLTVKEAMTVYDPENLSDEMIARNLEIFKKAQAANPQLNFEAIIRPDKLYEKS